MKTNLLEGLSIKDARELAEKNKKIVRVIVEDGEPLIVTSDLRSDRINVEVENGVVKTVVGVG